MFFVKERDHFEDLDVDWKIIFELIFSIVWAWTGLFGSRLGHVATPWDKVINFQVPQMAG